MRDLSISVRYVNAALKHTVARGLDPVALLRQNRISPRLLSENSARISIERYADLQVGTMLAMQDEAMGYAGERLPIGAWSMMCHAVIGAGTLGQALHRYCRFFQLFPFGAQPVLSSEHENMAISLRLIHGRHTVDPYISELALFNCHRFASWLVQSQLPLVAVELNHGAAADPADYRHMFQGNPVLFDATESRLVFAATLLDRPVVQNEQSLRRYLRHPVLSMLTQDYRGQSWSYQVRDLLRRDLAQMPELSDVGEVLEVHPQTLRRRLSAEGTSFKDIKNQLRRDTALHYLGKQGLSIEEIAHRAGFSESSAFIRAFKSWTGVTPYTYRKGL